MIEEKNGARGGVSGRTEEDDIELGEVERGRRVRVGGPVGVVRGSNGCRLHTDERLGLQRSLASEGRRECVFHAQLAGGRRSGGGREEVDDELVDTELGGIEKACKVCRKPSLALSDEGVIEPSRRHEGGGEDPLGREGAGVVDSVVESNKLATVVG